MAPGEIRHPLFARIYDRASPGAEKAGAADHRRELLEGLIGRVIEIGSGNGLNFGHYPREVTGVLAVEPEPYLRSKSQEAAAKADVDVEVVAGTADNLPAEAETFDAAVCSLVLCSVADQQRALAEARRVLKPAGELRFYEHVRSGSEGLARLQARLDRWIWPRVSGGCHVSRDTGAAIEAAGFTVERRRDFDFKPCFLAGHAAPHIIGRARR